MQNLLSLSFFVLHKTLNISEYSLLTSHKIPCSIFFFLKLKLPVVVVGVNVGTVVILCLHNHQLHWELGEI